MLPEASTASTRARSTGGISPGGDCPAALPAAKTRNAAAIVAVTLLAKEALPASGDIGDQHIAACCDRLPVGFSFGLPRLAERRSHASRLSRRKSDLHFSDSTDASLKSP